MTDEEGKRFNTKNLPGLKNLEGLKISSPDTIALY